MSIQQAHVNGTLSEKERLLRSCLLMWYSVSASVTTGMSISTISGKPLQNYKRSRKDVLGLFAGESSQQATISCSSLAGKPAGIEGLCKC